MFWNNSLTQGWSKYNTQDTKKAEKLDTFYWLSEVGNVLHWWDQMNFYCLDIAIQSIAQKNLHSANSNAHLIIAKHQKAHKNFWK